MKSETMGDFKETNRKLMQPEPLSQIVLMMSPSVLTHAPLSALDTRIGQQQLMTFEK